MYKIEQVSQPSTGTVSEIALSPREFRRSTCIKPSLIAMPTGWALAQTASLRSDVLPEDRLILTPKGECDDGADLRGTESAAGGTGAQGRTGRRSGIQSRRERRRQRIRPWPVPGDVLLRGVGAPAGCRWGRAGIS